MQGISDQHLLKFEFIADRDGKVSIWCKTCDRELHTDIETLFQAFHVAIPHTCPSESRASK